MFLDEAVITVRSGAGGDGCVSFRREKYIPRGGPDGGDGGRGGSVFLQGRSDLTTLIDISRRAVHRAEDGKPGGGNNRAGRNARDLVIGVPVGTVVREILPDIPPREGPVLGDLLVEGQRLRVARGGKGGRGNKAFATATHQVPREREEGTPGEERKLYLELKLIADVGLTGLPNAGKSTLLSRLSRATPKIADYPFTTLNPHLGIVELGDHERLVFADIPGLIEGAHRGAGLGIDFLRHVERTSILVHLVSCESGSAERMAADYRTVEAELASHSESLAAKPRLVAASKLDLLLPEEGEALVMALSREIGAEVLPLSAVTGRGVPELLTAAHRLLSKIPADGGASNPDS
jgi:GTP-binding protein